MQAMEVQSLVRELRFHMPNGVGEKKRTKKGRTYVFGIPITQSKPTTDFQMRSANRIKKNHFHLSILIVGI